MSNKQLSDQIKILIACCQTNPSEEDKDFIYSYLNSEKFQIHTFITLAKQHGVLPLVYKTIKNLSTIQHSIPTEILSELKLNYLQIVQKNMLMSAELIRIMKLFNEMHIEALAFKGPTLSQIAYGDITLRQYSDVDVLIKKEDLHKADNLLKEEGYERFLTLTPLQEKMWIKHTHDMGLVHPKKGIHFELHWSFLDEDYPMQVALEDYWSQTQTIAINREPITTFSNENLLIYLSIHGSKHLWERIEWVKDLDLLIRKKEINWETVIKRSKETGFEKMIYLGLSLSSQLFNTPLPKKVTQDISKLTVLESLCVFVLEQWEEPKSMSQKTVAMLKLFPGIKEKMIYLHKIILKPALNEYSVIDLPKGLYWVYYLLRPYLLLQKYLIKKKI